MLIYFVLFGNQIITPPKQINDLSIKNPRAIYQIMKHYGIKVCDWRSDSSFLRLLQSRLEKEEFEDELKELKEKVSTIKQQKPDPKHTESLNQVQ